MRSYQRTLVRCKGPERSKDSLSDVMDSFELQLKKLSEKREIG